MSIEKQPKLTAKDQWLVFKRLLRYTIPHKKSIIIALVLLILTITGSIVGPLIIQRFIDNHLTTMNFPENEIMNYRDSLYRYSSVYRHRVLFPIHSFSRYCIENYSTNENRCVFKSARARYAIF